jgi:hypothetical protein
MKNIVVLWLPILFVTCGVATSRAAAADVAMQPFVQRGMGATPRTLSEKARDTVHIADFGGGPGKTATENANAINKALAWVRVQSGWGGGRVLLGPGVHDVAPDLVSISENGALEGQTPVADYAGTYIAGGTVLQFTGRGAFGVIMEVSRAALRNITIRRTSGTLTYCLVVTGSLHNVENVTTEGCDYGIVAGGGLNSVVFRNVTTINHGAVGFSILPVNTGGVGALTYPSIQSRISARGNTATYIENLISRQNRVGVALLDGLGLVFHKGVVESNTHHAIVGFKRAKASNLDNITFRDMWFENNNLTPPANQNLSGIDLLLVSNRGVGYLKGSTSGPWTASSDAGADLWLGSETEAYMTGDIYNYSGGAPSHWRFENCMLMPLRYGARLRSSRWVTYEHSHMQSMSGNSWFLNITPNAYGTHIKEPRSYALDSEIKLFTVGGTRTTYTMEDTQNRGSVAAAVSGEWVTIANVKAMSRGNKYEFAAGVPGHDCASYCAQGYVVFDGTSYTLAKAATGAAFDARVFDGNLQVMQRSGKPRLISWRIWPRGQLGHV